MTEPVPFVALDREHHAVAAELRSAFDRVVRSSGFILGEEVARFEDGWAAACGTSHCVGVGSGTAALTLLLRAAGIRRGDEVIVPGHTYVASALGVIHAGAVPVLCDVDDGTGLLDVDAAADAVTSRTTAILAVHLYGQVCDMRALGELAKRHGLALFEDAAQAHGARWAGRPAGSLGDGAAFSFYPSKNLGALGDGGAICTDDAVIAERARRLRDLGQRRKGEHVELGVNERLDGLQAALLNVKLARLEEGNQTRRRYAAAYRERLEGHVALLEERPASPCVYHLFPVRVASRSAVAEQLRSAGIGTGVHYAPALHWQPVLRGHVVAPYRLPNAEAWAAEELSLPMSPALRSDEVERAADACVEAVVRSSALEGAHA
ncbi:MAG TPA: DegT/DnrJ/EryC1/StrS family aminotransferase [Solirubrobacteraceae bacterium]|nr:DegT/DnrJ/EryC1/StrS family aminotransferase [Solirubrobacteraceae bacterium]